MDTITVRLSLGNESWYLTGVYASPVYTKRLDLWNHIIDLRRDVDGPWLLMGDFNDIIHPSEQRGGNFSPTRAAALANVMDKCSLVDVSSTGGNLVQILSDASNMCKKIPLFLIKKLSEISESVKIILREG
jgi:hypothetical protein